MQSYNVTLTLDSNTLAQIQANKWVLQAFMGAQSDATGTPVVWNALNVFSSSNSITWTPQYGAYYAQTIPASGAVIVETTATGSIDLGQALVLNSDGSSAVQSGPSPTSFTFINNNNGEWGCGLTSVNSSGQSVPNCLFNSFPTADVLIEPLQILLLEFVQMPVIVGSVVEETISASVTIIMSPTTQQQTTVSFDIISGWNFGSNPNVTINEPNVELAPLLYPPAQAARSSAKKAAAYK